MLAEARGSDHDITPVRGSARQLDGTLADLLVPMDYPCEALCAECGGAIRCERWFLGPWMHIPWFTFPGQQP